MADSLPRSAVSCLTAIAQHHGLQVNPGRLVDEFALLPKGSLLDAGMGTTSFSGIGDTVCALQDGDGIAVTTADDITRKMMLTLVADRARVYESPGGDFRFRDVNPRRQAQLEIQMSIDAKATAAAEIREALTNDPAVTSVDYVDHQQAYKQFRRDFGDEPGVLDAPRPGNFPESFRVAVKPGADVEAFAQRYERRPGVEYIQRAYDVCEY